MAQSTLIIYDSIESVPEDERSYWRQYIDFYEQYWGGPMSPFGIWFGNEYGNFRRAIADHMGVEEPAVRDCFFIRSEDGVLYVCPLGGAENPNILSCENAVPFEWFAAFEESGRRNFYSHWGFSSIHYNTKVGPTREKLAAAEETLSRAFDKTDHEKLRAMVEWMEKGVRNMDRWFSGREEGGYAVLNYGDVCSVLTPQSLDRERSVEQVAKIFSLLDEGKWKESYEISARFFQKWEDLRQMCAAAGGDEPLQ
ncbi:MAG: hypothetical protein GKS04_04970 [Candidatus Mycalebacterium zealandia]|nr:MAG: hypothetical protein GKS04_04970 [Candidatus Mycalebacterium zealandia]